MIFKALVLGCAALSSFAMSALAGSPHLRGHVVDQGGTPVTNARVRLLEPPGLHALETATTFDGSFQFAVAHPGTYLLEIEAPTFQASSQSFQLGLADAACEVRLAPQITRNESITVTADVDEVDLIAPDPAEKVFVRQDLLDANPGRPGAPVSIPGYPIETASSGIKAPQYFAPGVAGDHGEPIAQFIAVGSYLVPNNLSANAHGNGYADPNIFIPEVIETVQVDGGAYNVREGNHSVNLAATYGLRSHLQPFATVTGDTKDVDLVAGFNPGATSWIALAGSYGNGFLARLEHRQQYKLNGERVYSPGHHRLTMLGIAYYGFSYVPGLVPLFARDAGDQGFPNVGDTVDPRQRDQTHTALLAANDVWRLTGSQQLDFSGFFRTYNLSLFSDFGQGLIRQSEFRTVTGASTYYTNRIVEAASLLAGFDMEREAPRRDNLDRYGFYTPPDQRYGPFTKVDSNNVTITPLTPYAAIAGAPARFIRYYAGWRRDQIDFDNQDLVTPTNSFQKWVGVNSPKATLAFIPKPNWLVPVVSLSYGQSFFTEDPRIGTGTAIGTPVATSHSYQFVASKSFHATDLKFTLGHTTSSQELAKIDPDTGLQFNEGPSRLLFAAVTVRQGFSHGSLLATFSKADARDLDSGQPTPEAPRTIGDLLGAIDRLPLKLQARSEFEYVGKKPLGTGCLPNVNAQCVGVPVREFRGAVVRPFPGRRLDVGLNFLVANGYSGQTTENFGASPIQEVVGVRIPSYASLSLTYHFAANATR